MCYGSLFMIICNSSLGYDFRYLGLCFPLHRWVDVILWCTRFILWGMYHMLALWHIVVPLWRSIYNFKRLIFMQMFRKKKNGSSQLLSVECSDFTGVVLSFSQETVIALPLSFWGSEPEGLRKHSSGSRSNVGGINSYIPETTFVRWALLTCQHLSYHYKKQDI
jgi:hypothetical protein